MITLQLIRGNEMTELPTESITWSGQRYHAARKLEARVYYRQVRMGDTLLFKWYDNEVFRGTVFTTSLTKDMVLSVTAYDMLQYLMLNKDVYVFNNRNLSQIFIRICNDKSIPYSVIEGSRYVIKSLSFVNETSLYDMVLKAMIETEKHTGVKYRLESRRGKAQLLPPSSAPRMHVLETGRNIEDFTLTSSIEETATQVKLVTGEEDDQKTSIVRDDEGRSRYGVLQHFEKVTEDLNQAQLDHRANTILRKRRGRKETLDLEGLGHREIYSGRPVHVTIDNPSTDKKMIVDDDMHTFEGNSHRMSISVIDDDEFPEVN
ncbi:hypothetical protein [Geomicrobium sp. JCM 19039]|uniref:XkdQ/YqbQ family protein n=1 Tax=Geomicrobium sp. JCM 19039 TaxID=1460636 RepID=UPI00045F13D4|nr:hypothetical protein [Geomicrobium sp. JCM 19039]GAK11405.1 phage-like element PBSX protein XkdQ [Geomicrobium sp. JCM 19039]